MNRILLILLAWLISFSAFSQNNDTGNDGYQLIKNILYPDTENVNSYILERCHLDLYFPENTSGFTTVIWFHGGGITSGEKFIPERLMGKGIAIISANYRLYPGAKNPEYIEDAASAVAWAFENIGKYGGDPDKIVVSGHSAGGYLAMMVGLDKKWLGSHGIDANRIAALVPFSGHTITHMTIRKERGISNKQPVVDEYAPLWHVRADAPPLHLISGDRELEMLGRYEETAYMWRMMKVAGHKSTYLYELDGFDHGGMASPAYDLLLKILKNSKL
jgi:acetyl esterase/lipase